MVETVTTGLMDRFPKIRHYKLLTVMACCTVFFLLGLTLTTNVSQLNISIVKSKEMDRSMYFQKQNQMRRIAIFTKKPKPKTTPPAPPPPPTKIKQEINNNKHKCTQKINKKEKQTTERARTYVGSWSDHTW